MNVTESGFSVGFQLSDWLGVLAPGFVALILGLLTMVALAFAIHRKSWGWGVATVAAFLLFAVSAGFTVVGAGRMARKHAVKSAQPWVITSEDGQHRLTIPGHWTKDTKLAEEQPVIGVSNRIREQYLILSSVPRGNGTELKDWVAAMREEMAGNIEDATMGEIEPRTIGEHPALFSRIAGRVDRLKIVYHITFLQLPDEFVYIMCWTLPSREQAGFAIFDKVVSSYTYTPGEESASKPAIAYDPGAPIPERVQVLVANQLGIPRDRVTPESEVSALGFDELDTVELVMTLEEEFGGEIADDVAEKMKTVGDLIRWAEGQKKPTQPPPESAAP